MSVCDGATGASVGTLVLLNCWLCLATSGPGGGSDVLALSAIAEPLSDGFLACCHGVQCLYQTAQTKVSTRALASNEMRRRAPGVNLPLARRTLQPLAAVKSVKSKEGTGSCASSAAVI